MPRGIPGSITHGGAGTAYVHHGCRCDLCRRANADRANLRRAKRTALTDAGQLPEQVPHGHASTYINWGCRCQPCKSAHYERWKAGRDRAAARGIIWQTRGYGRASA